MIGAIPWIIVYSFGWFVAILGYVIGFCAVQGYDLLGGKQVAKGKAIIVITFAVLGVIVSQIFGDLLMLVQAYASGDIDAPLWSILIIVPLLFTDLEFVRDSFINLGLGLAFAGLGVFTILRSMFDSADDEGYLEPAPTMSIESPFTAIREQRERVRNKEPIDEPEFMFEDD